MNFYKGTENFLINLDLVTKVAMKDKDWYVYFIGDKEGTYIMHRMASEIKKIVFSKSEEKKEKRTISLICDRCCKPFKLNVIFDENGECNNILSRLCSECINSLLDKKENGDSTNGE